MSNTKNLYLISRKTVAPILIEYTRWVLNEAHSRGIKTLYFLARDGYVLQKIAQYLASKFDYGINCRYLYCSRASLRIPTYHLIGEEAYDLIFQYDHQITLNSFFRRVNTPDPLKLKILQQLGLSYTDTERILTPSEVAVLRQKLQTNQLYNTHVMEHSRNAFQNIVGYFSQEGLFNQSSVAIVDSGWTGSMQRSLRQILNVAGYQGTLTGFYFGMLSKPKSRDDGTYLTWYFSPDYHPFNQVCFNIYLFECILSAPHGMTMGYTHVDGRYSPILSEIPSDEMLQHIDQQIQGILDALSEEEFIRTSVARRQFRRLMAFPSREEVNAYNCFRICSDTTEDHFVRLADASSLEYLKKMTIPKRLWRKICRRKIAEKPLPLWPGGTLAYAESPLKRTWYRINFAAYDLLEYLRQTHLGK